MTKFRVICADPPYGFDDGLTMNDVKRGAASNYKTLTLEDIKNLPIKEITEDDAVLALWVPSSLLTEGLEIMKSYGFRQTQTWVWNKTKKEIKPTINLDEVLSFGMGRLFRQTHEIVLLGVKGKIYSYIQNKSQRSVSFDPATKHSTKPETLQNRLEIMFPNSTYLELFGRRERKGWTVLGNEVGERKDIRDSLAELIAQNATQSSFEQQL